MGTVNGKSGYWGSDGSRCTVQFSLGFKEDDGSGLRFVVTRRHYVPIDIFSFVVQGIDNYRIDSFGYRKYYLPYFYRIPEDAVVRRETFNPIALNSLNNRHAFCLVYISSAEEFIHEIRELWSRVGVDKRCERFFTTITFDNGDSLHLVLYVTSFESFGEGEDRIHREVLELRYMEAESGNG